MDYTLSINENELLIVPSGKLSYNTIYTITIDSDISGVHPVTGSGMTMDSDYTFWFTSSYCPLFATLNTVKTMTGPSSDTLLDAAIYRMILFNSKQAVDIYNISHSKTYSYNYWGCDPTNVPYQMRRYVECKTAYDILALLKQINTASGGGDQVKTLGDMTIKYGGDRAYSGDTPSKMKELYDCWNSALRALQSIDVAVRGYYDGSKGFTHPVREPEHNRVVRPVIRNCGVNNPNGPWVRGYPWRRFNV